MRESTQKVCLGSLVLLFFVALFLVLATTQVECKCSFHNTRYDPTSALAIVGFMGTLALGIFHRVARTTTSKSKNIGAFLAALFLIVASIPIGVSVKYSTKYEGKFEVGIEAGDRVEF